MPLSAAALHFAIAEVTLRKLAREGKFPFVRFGERARIKVKLSQLEAIFSK